MASGRNYADGRIVNGLIAKRLYDCPSDYFFLNNIARMLQENQTKMLADQSAVDGWSPALATIPNARFHVGTGRDFNALSCNLIYNHKNNQQGLTLFRRIEANMIVTVETGDTSFDVWRRAESYNRAFAEILIEFFTFAKQELCWDATNNRFIDCGIEDPQVTGGGLVNTANLPGIDRPLGFLPTVNIAFSVHPPMSQKKLP